MPVQTQLQIRRDTAANWTSVNPTLAGGEWGLETDTRQYKIGDGATAWNSLGYQLGPLLDEEIASDPTGAYFDGTGLRTFGVGSNFAATRDSAALSITGDIDLRVKVKLNSWTPSTAFALLTKNFPWSYGLEIQQTTGLLILFYSTDGSTLRTVTSIATNLANDATKWVRATLDVNNGAGGHDIAFYLSDDGTTWTQLGTTTTVAGTITLFDSSADLNIGARGNTNPTIGTFYRAQVLNGIGGTTAFDADFSAVPADSFAFTESSANAATVTLTTTRYSFGLPGVNLFSTVTFALIQNSTYYNYFRIAGKVTTIKHIAFESTVAPASNATVRIAIYASDANMQPTGAPIYDTGAITVSNAAAAVYRIRVTPFTLLPGNYVIAFNTSVAFTIRGFSNITWPTNTLGAQLVVFRRVGQTLSGAYPNPGLKWNTIGGASSSTYNFALLGWS